MALVSSSDPDLRIYEPAFSSEYSSRAQDAVHRSRLLAKIHSAYCKALERLTTNSKARPGAAKRIVGGGGFCFGLLDPASNIIANTLVPCPPDKGTGERGDDAAAGAAPEAKIEDLERRSLEGMVTFLTRFFPYLADCEAVRYLLAADADLLVATRIVATDRRMKRFGHSELAVEEALRMALKCAALAARHPDPDRLVGAWRAVSRRLDDVVCLLAKVQRRSASSGLDDLAALLDGPAPPVDDRRGDLLRAWKLAMSRPPRPRRVPYQNTSTPLKRALLDAIHGFYLQALARLPAAGELRSRCQRSLVKAGHCYGPLDPVSNILLNTIWYDASCPPAMKLELDMVSTLGLHRIETRSLYGLVSFLCTRYHNLDFHHATRLLLESDASLLLADPNLDAEAAAAAATALRSEERKRLHSPWAWSRSTATGRVDTKAQGPASSVIKAFKAAANAGWHPNPDGQANILASCKTLLGSAIALLQGDGQLSSEGVQELSKLLLSPESPCEKPLLPLHLEDLPLPFREYLRTHSRVSRNVKVALDGYSLMPNGEPAYELHAICGFNNQVSGPVYCPEIDTCPPEKFYHTHVNFLATPKGTHSHTNGAPVLFFAEITNDDGNKAQTLLCCPVSVPPPCAERVRCLYCDYVGIRIVHPSGESFNGREEDFENMVCEKDPYDEDFDPLLMPQYYTNEGIISDSSHVAERIGRLEEDCMYPESDENKESDDYDTDMDYATDEYELI